MDAQRYALANAGSIPSPALIYYEDIIRSNTELAIRIAGGADRLWPHIKTHKTAELIRMQLDMGITRFKCATIAELRLAARCGAEHLLLAYPLVGPNIALFLDTIGMFPDTHFYALGDSAEAVAALDAAAGARGLRVDWLADVNMGMNRTGVPVDELAGFCVKCAGFTSLRLRGLHCYDGQVHDADIAGRSGTVASEMALVGRACAELGERGISTDIVIAGGSPTFPCHALEAGVFLSPGTVFVWDYGYATAFRDLPFEPGAALLARVVSHPAPGVFTLDLGYKAISPDPQGARGLLLGLAAEPMFQSEEHWTWRMLPGHEPELPAIGSEQYVIPTHICPTTALHRAVWVAHGGVADARWEVAARDRD